MRLNNKHNRKSPDKIRGNGSKRKGKGFKNKTKPYR